MDAGKVNCILGLEGDRATGAPRGQEKQWSCNYGGTCLLKDDFIFAFEFI